jgi:preprotein translocase subunit Sec63
MSKSRQAYFCYTCSELTRDIFTMPFKEAEAVIKNKFRTLALKFHPDRKGGDTAKFREMNEAKEYLMGEMYRMTTLETAAAEAKT